MRVELRASSHVGAEVHPSRPDSLQTSKQTTSGPFIPEQQRSSQDSGGEQHLNVSPQTKSEAAARKLS